MAQNLSLVLLGKTGSGKSSFGNALLHNQSFQVGGGPVSVTEHCSARDGACVGRSVRVLDTPGTMDVTNPQRAISKIRTAIDSFPDGVDAFLVVVSWKDRFTEESSKATEEAVGVFGSECYKRTIIVFTHVDQNEIAMFQDKLGQVRTQVPRLHQVLNKLGNRYLPIDNGPQCSSEVKDEQIRKLIGLCDSVSNCNPIRYRRVEFEAEQRRQEEERRRQEEMREMERRQHEARGASWLDALQAVGNIASAIGNIAGPLIQGHNQSVAQRVQVSNEMSRASGLHRVSVGSSSNLLLGTNRPEAGRQLRDPSLTHLLLNPSYDFFNLKRM